MKNTPHSPEPAHFDLAAFVAQFPLFARAPNGIANLRALILQLAVQGKLVPQDPNDEPASVLLEKIAAEKERLILEGKIKRQKPLSIGKEKPFDLPIKWKWVLLTDLLAIVTDGDHQPPPKTENGIPFLVIGNVNKGRLFLDECRFVSDEYYQALDWGRKPLKGDILYTVTGSYGIPVYINSDEIFCVQRHIAILKSTESSPNSYLPLVLSSKYAVDYATQVATGIAQKTVPLSGLRQMLIPLPPLEEQQRIVAKVDELMVLCDQLEAQQDDQARNLLEANTAVIQAVMAFSSKTLTPQPPLPEVEGEQELVSLSPSTSGRGVGVRVFDQHWQRIATHFNTLYGANLPLPSDMRRGKLKDRTVALENIAKLRELILQLAVMGKLVPQDPNDEPASVLLEKIAAEKECLILEGKIKRQKSLAKIKDEEKPFESPNGWEWIRLDYLALGSDAGWSPTCESIPRQQGNWGVLKVSAVTWGIFKPEENKELPKNLDPKPEYEVRAGDFLISRANTAELVARAVIVPENTPTKLMLSDKIIRFIFTSMTNKNFIILVNSSNFARNYYAQVAGGTSSSMKNVSREQIRSLVLALPPLEEQHRIVAQVDELMALCDTLETLLTEQRQVAADFSAAAVQAVTA
ncbi:restriction endonuclease subunit S [Thiothrix winogradskyi]|uniref:Restriction endonuclease subunit S n=1 Tax=Thiothrix winogradskyi TaxID=96472 RepID=A0ABY3T2Z4_9GAMM|nr:restriction endonuclease subunit S [Thiothrix winogradskyi]UJS25589.1 restriction endonuclease subunit S [Thiothrix winogradskyi]